MLKQLYLVVCCLCVHEMVHAQSTYRNFVNEDSINIPDYGPSQNLYPSSILVSGMAPYLSSIQVTLRDIVHLGGGDDIDILLEAPNGERIILMSDIDFGYLLFLSQRLRFNSLSNVILSRETFQNLSTLTFKPTNLSPDADTFPQLGVIQQPNPTLSNLEGINPNGQWKLYVVGDSLNGESGRIAAGWDLDIYASTTPVCPRPELPIVKAVTDSSATIDIRSPNSVMKWDFYYGLAPLTPPTSADSTFSVNGQTENIIVNNLTPQKNYQLYIRSNCGGSRGRSTWVGPLNFTTEFYPCKYGKTITPCERVVNPTDIVSGYQVNTCNGLSPVANQVYRFFKPPTTGKYWLKNDGILSQVYYIALTDSCGRGKWNCAQREETKHRLLGTLSKDSTYLILVETPVYEGYNFQITACPAPDISLKSTELGPFEGILRFEGNQAALVGVYDLYYGVGTLGAPTASTTPTKAAVNITDGSLFLSGLTAGSDYQIYLRSSCEASRGGCWQGPFLFKTEPYCGSLQLLSVPFTSSSTAVVKWRSNPNVYWEFYYRPLNRRDDTSFLKRTLSVLQDTFDVYFDQMYGNTTYEVYAKANCFTTRQPLQGPFYFSTNDLCFREPIDIACGQQIRQRTDSTSTVISHLRACTEANNEVLYRFKAPESGTVYLHTNGSGTRGESNLEFYLKRPGELCDVYGWEYLGCWRNYSRTDDFYFYVQKDSTYYLLGKGGGLGFYYDFSIKGCCNPPKNLKIQEITATTALVTWQPTDQERKWQLRWNIDNGYRFPVQTVENNTPFRITNLLPNTTYNFYINSICDNRTSNEQLLKFTTTDTLGIVNYGVFNHSNPFFVRPEGEPDRAYFYEQINFSTIDSGAYSFTADLTVGGGCRLLLYEAPFDRENPTNRLVQTYENAEPFTPVTAVAHLARSKEYALVATTQDPLNIGFAEGRSILSITSPAPIRFVYGKFNGRNLGPYGKVPPTSMRLSGNYRVRDVHGWIHFYNNGENLIDLKDDYLLLSMQFDSAIYTAPRTLPRVDGLPGVTKLTNPPTRYVRNPTGWFVMNRYWNLDLSTALQPINPLKIRFYFTQQDFESLRDTIARTGGNPPQQPKNLYFYKINDYDGRYNPNPALKHLNVPAATAYDQDGYWEYAPGDSATATTWSLGQYKNAYYAEMLVKRFSGGGGGLAGDYGGGALTDVTDARIDNDFIIYPNPFNNVITIQSKKENISIQHLRLTDALGRVIVQKEEILPTGTVQLELPNMPVGFYILTLDTGTFKQTFKLLKQ